MRRPQPDQPPVLGELQNFTLTTQAGKRLSLSDLHGSVVVANFIFTSCTQTCPQLTQQMAKIQNRLMGTGPIIRLLSISVDPETDTPEKLKEFADKYQADYKIWSFLTGDLESIEKVVTEGFKIAMDRSKDSVSLMDITHGEHFVILDQLGRIRAYKTAHNTDQINEIVRTVAILANTQPQMVQAR